MRRLFLFSPLAVAACAAPPPSAKVIPTPRPPIIIPAERGDLVGQTQSQVLQRLGQPALTVREGDSLKLQWRAASCVLDAYFYGENGGALKVAHVEARTPAGVDTDKTACLSVLSRI